MDFDHALLGGSTSTKHAPKFIQGIVIMSGPTTLSAYEPTPVIENGPASAHKLATIVEYTPASVYEPAAIIEAISAKLEYADRGRGSIVKDVLQCANTRVKEQQCEFLSLFVGS